MGAAAVVYADVMREGGSGGRSRGCGIVEFETAEEAAAAINTLNDVELDGRPIFVREDREDRDLVHTLPPPLISCLCLSLTSPPLEERGYTKCNPRSPHGRGTMWPDA